MLWTAVSRQTWVKNQWNISLLYALFFSFFCSVIVALILWRGAGMVFSNQTYGTLNKACFVLRAGFHDNSEISLSKVRCNASHGLRVDWVFTSFLPTPIFWWCRCAVQIKVLILNSPTKKRSRQSVHFSHSAFPEALKLALKKTVCLPLPYTIVAESNQGRSRSTFRIYQKVIAHTNKTKM